MLMVVLGAGASFDSVSFDVSQSSRDDRGWQPPLAAGLFAERGTFSQIIDKYPRCGPLIMRLRSLGDGILVEEALEQYEKEAEDYPGRRSQLMAIRFYLRDVLTLCSERWPQTAHGLTNYRGLVDYLLHWQARSGEEVVFVTFNYDTLLEQAWTEETGHDFRNLGSYLKAGGAQILKVHGSINWARPVPFNDILIDSPRQLIDKISEFPDFGNITWRPDVSLVPANNERFVPALAVPMRNKNAFECPSDHLEALRAALPKTSRMLVIGWAGADRHFLQECRKAGAAPQRTLVVTGTVPDANPTIGALSRSGINLNLDDARCSFTELIAEPTELDRLLTR